LENYDTSALGIEMIEVFKLVSGLINAEWRCPTLSAQTQTPFATHYSLQLARISVLASIFPQIHKKSRKNFCKYPKLPYFCTPKL
jgi:hypothetical protein